MPPTSTHTGVEICHLEKGKRLRSCPLLSSEFLGKIGVYFLAMTRLQRPCNGVVRATLMVMRARQCDHRYESENEGENDGKEGSLDHCSVDVMGCDGSGGGKIMGEDPL